MSGPPPTGWYVEIDVDGQTLTPTVADDPAWIPSLNGKPEADIPVPRDDALWLSGAADRADARVWLDGTRLPIDTAEVVRSERRGGSQQTLLETFGGRQLDRRVSREVDSKAAHAVVDDLVTTETDYIANVDVPDRQDIEGRVIQSATDASGLTDLFGDEIDTTTPVEIDSQDDVLRPLQTAFTFTSDELNNSHPTVSDSAAEQDTAVNLTDSGQSLFGDFEPAYELPADTTSSELGVAIRARVGPNVSSSTGVFAEVSLGGTRLSGFDVDSFGTSFEWQTDSPTQPTSNVSGFRTIEASLDGGLSASEGFVVDAIVIFDERFPPRSFDNAPDPYFATPAEFGDGITVSSPVRATQLLATELTATVQTDSGITTNLGVGVSGDSGGSYTTATDTDTVTETFNAGTDTATLRLELSGQGTANRSPDTRVSPHEVTDVELTGDFSGVPRLVNESLDGDLGDVLREIAEKTGSAWELRYDDSAGSFAIEWSDPGQRESDATLSASAYEVERDASTVVEAATVTGGRRRVQNEQVTASISSPVALDQSRLITGVVEVESKADGTEYEVGVDYVVDHRNGSIEALPSGTISDGESLRVDYQYKVSGRFESATWAGFGVSFGFGFGAGPGDPSTDILRDIPQIPSTAAAEQAATRLVRQTDPATLSARVDLGGIDPTQSVLATLAVDELGVTDAWTVRRIVRTPESPRVLLGAGVDVEDAVDTIRRTIGDVGQRV